MSNLAAQIREALSMFVRSGTEPALIGGLAVVAHQVVRATKAVDFLVEAEAADKVHAALIDLGYECLYRSEDAANYVRAAEGLNLLYAHRHLARRLLAQASERETPMGRMRIISVEGLIGFKLQGFVNDATRTRDLDDIRSLFKIHLTSLPWMRCVSTLPCSTNQTSLMNYSDNAESNSESAIDRADAGVVLAREAGVPFHLPMGKASGVDPFTEWLSLMEVVQMLCLEWPVRDKPMQGKLWRI